jgi:DMSO reductase family type II enzyme heme b subunit
VRAVKLRLATRTLLNPVALQWEKLPVEEVRLGAPPLHKQPSHYIRTVWAGRPMGAVRAVGVRAAHNGDHIAFRLEWGDATEDRGYGDNSTFPDAAAVLLPANGDAPLDSMGTPEAPTIISYWRANLGEGEAEDIVGTGLGVFEMANAAFSRARALWEKGRWVVVLARPLKVKRGGKGLVPGRRVRVGFAVWEGSSQERAGITALSRRWLDLEVQ